MSPISEASYVISGAQDERKMQSPPLKKNDSEYEDICKGPSECQARSHIEKPALSASDRRTHHTRSENMPAGRQRKAGTVGSSRVDTVDGDLELLSCGELPGPSGESNLLFRSGPQGVVVSL